MKEIKSPYDVFFISDTHIAHKNILKHSPERIKQFGLADENDMINHDKYIINMFKSMTKRGDHVYVLGDFIMTNQQESKKILNEIKSNGVILHLIAGNHDKSIHHMYNMFESIDLIKCVTFKKSVYPFLEEDFQTVLCHYPMKSWSNKCRGSVNLYGHVHNNSPWLDNSNDLALNVGLDAPFSEYKLIPLEKIYKWYKNKLHGMKPKEYVDFCSTNNEFFVR